MADSPRTPQPNMVDGVGHCTDACGQHDGKRCEILGMRPGYGVCEPWAAELSARAGDEFNLGSGYHRKWQKAVKERDALLAHIALHPYGACTCAGEGKCGWCARSNALEALEWIAACDEDAPCECVGIARKALAGKQ